MKRSASRAAASAPAYAVQCSLKIAMAIRRKSLQGLQQHRGGHEGSRRPSSGRGQARQNISVNPQAWLADVLARTNRVPSDIAKLDERCVR